MTAEQFVREVTVALLFYRNAVEELFSGMLADYAGWVGLVANDFADAPNGPAVIQGGKACVWIPSLEAYCEIHPLSLTSQAVAS